MSKLDIFSRRYSHRISGGLYDDDLWLHDYDEAQRDADQRGENKAAAYKTHVDHELHLRQQVQTAVSYSQGARGQGRLPDGPRAELADLYEQTNSELRQVAGKPFDTLFTREGAGPADEPVRGEKYERPARVLIFDYVEAIYDTLSSSGKTEFSRELNQRLSAGGSPWMFVMGRWRREDWETERDTPFDETLHRLSVQARNAERRRLRALDGEDYGPPVEDRASAPSKDLLEDLSKAARGLYAAERLLHADPEIADYSNRKAVERAREAFDICAKIFPDAVYGPFVRYQPPKKAEDPNRGDPYTDLDRGADARPAGAVRLKDQETGDAALLRLSRLYEHALHHAADKERAMLLRRAPMAEFLARLVLFGPSEKDDARYARATRLHGLEGEFGGHHAGKLPLKVSDMAEAQLAIDVLARLCLYAAGADLPVVEDGRRRSDLAVKAGEARRRMARMLGWVRNGFVAIVLLGAGAAAGWYAATHGLFGLF